MVAANCTDKELLVYHRRFVHKGEEAAARCIEIEEAVAVGLSRYMCTRRYFYFQNSTDVFGRSGRSDTQILSYLYYFPFNFYLGQLQLLIF